MSFSWMLRATAPVLSLFLIGCSAQPETAQEHLSRGMKHLAAAELQQAEREFREVLRTDASNQKAVRELGFVYSQQGQIAQALPLLKKSAEALPDDINVQLALALAYFTARDLDHAREIAQNIVDKDPNQEDAVALIADTARTTEEMESSRRFLDEHIKNHDSASYHLGIGALEWRQRKFATAEVELKAALERNPKSAVANAALANIYWSRQDIKQADAAFKKAAELSLPRSPAKLRYIDFKLRTGDKAAANEMIEEIARQSPEFLPTRVYLMAAACSERREDCASKVEAVLAQDQFNYEALYQSGVLSFQRRDIARAIRIFDQLTKFNDRDVRTRYQLALAYLASTTNASPADARNAIDTAENNLNIAHQLDPSFDDATLLLSELKIRKGASAAAVDLLKPLVQAKPQLAKAQSLLGAAYSTQGLNAQAAEVYQQMVEAFPKDPEPPLLLARLLIVQKRPAEARKALEKSLEISPAFLPAIELLIDVDIDEKKYDNALQRVQPLIEQDAKAAQPLAMRGKIYAAQGDLQRAEADLAKAVQLDPKLEPAQILLSQILISEQKPDKAIEALKTYTSSTKSANAYQQLAALYLKQNQVNEARDTYEELLKFAPNFSLALNNLAVLYSDRLGQLDKALNLASKAREITPNEAHIGDTIGWIAFKRGDYQTALRELKVSAGKLPDPEGQYHLGMVYYMLGEEEQSKLALQKAVDSQFDFTEKPDALERLSILRLKSESASKPQLERTLATKPDDPVVLSRLAALDSDQGKFDEAKAKLEKILDKSPQFAPATRQLALVYSKLSSQDPKAYDITRNARQSYPNDAEIAKLLGILNYRRSLFPQSVELLKEAAAKRNDDPELLYYLADDYRQLKNFEACKETVQLALGLKLSKELIEPANKILSDCSETPP